MKHISLIALAAAVLLLANGASATEHEQEIRKILPEIRSAVLRPDIIDALRAQNERYRDVTQSSIDSMEATWQSELESSTQPLISSIVDNKLAVRMRRVAEATGVEDIVVIDARGLSVAQSTAGTEVWLGREPEFAKTVETGRDAVFVDEVDYHEPTQSYQSRVSFTVIDPDTSEPIGAITIGFNVDAL